VSAPSNPDSSPPPAGAPGEDELRRQALVEIRRILGEQRAAAASANVELSQALVADIHLDSMELLTLAVGLENRFRVKLNEADSAGIVTVGDLVDLVVRRAMAGRSAP